MTKFIEFYFTQNVLLVEDKLSESQIKKKNRKATKDLKLLSFGEEEQEDDQLLDKFKGLICHMIYLQIKIDLFLIKIGGIKSSHDVLNDPKLLKEIDPEVERLSKFAPITDNHKKGKN